MESKHLYILFQSTYIFLSYRSTIETYSEKMQHV